MCVLYTLFYSLESKTKLKIGAELSDHKNTVKLFTNFGHFFIIFSTLKNARMGQCPEVFREGYIVRKPARVPGEIEVCQIIGHM